MMIDRRLVRAVPETVRPIAIIVLLQWISLVANIAMVMAFCWLLQRLYAGVAEPSDIAVPAIVVLSCSAIRFGCSLGAAWAATRSSRAVKRTLRTMIYEKLLRLGAGYRRTASTSEVVQIAIEGTEQLETYFAAYLPQLLYALLAPLTLFAVLSGVSLRAALVLLACVPLIPVAIAFTLLALIRDRVFRALRRLAPAKLEGRGKGDLISIITSDIELLEVFYAHTVSPVVIALLFSLIVTGFLAWTDPVLALIALAAYACVGVVAPCVISRATGSRGLSYRVGAGRLSSFTLESLRGLDEIQQFGCGPERLRQMHAQDAMLADDEWGLKCSAGVGTGSVNAVILGFDSVMLGAVALLAVDGALGFGDAMVALLAFMGSFGPVVALANLGSTLQGTFAAGSRVLDILDEEPVCRDVTGMPRTGFSGAVARDVSFSYGGEDVIKGGSLEAPEGAIVGVCGKSGSGKSTLLRLFMRFWDVDRGDIEISGRSISRVNTSDLRGLESLVTQETQLFHDTIRNNIRIAKLDATDGEIERACRKASIHEFIASLPHGYDTQVGGAGRYAVGRGATAPGVGARIFARRAVHAARRADE